MSDWALQRAAAYGAAEGRTVGQTWAVRVLCGEGSADRPPRPNAAAEEWITRQGYATMPRGVLSRCVRADVVTPDERAALASTSDAGLAAAFDRAFSEAVAAVAARDGIAR